MLGEPIDNFVHDNSAWVTLDIFLELGQGVGTCFSNLQDLKLLIFCENRIENNEKQNKTFEI